MATDPHTLAPYGSSILETFWGEPAAPAAVREALPPANAPTAGLGSPAAGSGASASGLGAPAATPHAAVRQGSVARRALERVHNLEV